MFVCQQVGRARTPGPLEIHGVLLALVAVIVESPRCEGRASSSTTNDRSPTTLSQLAPPPSGDLPPPTERLRKMLRLFLGVFSTGLVLIVLGRIVDSLTPLFAAFGVAGLSAILLVAIRIQMRSSPEAVAALKRTSKSGGTSQVTPPWFVVEQPDPRFSARARRLIGPWYAIEVLDSTNGNVLPLAASAPLTGRGSVERAVKYGIRRFYRTHPDERYPEDSA